MADFCPIKNGMDGERPANERAIADQLRTNTQFTPGPWEVHPIMAWVCVAGKLEDSPICGMCRTADGIDEDANFANARLIAAAPELYWALDLVREHLILNDMDTPRVMEKIDEALAKARGEA